MSARGRPLRPAWSRRSPQCRGRLVPHPLRQWGKVWRAASARQQQDRLKCRHWDEEKSSTLNGPRSMCDVGVSAGTGLCCRRRRAAGAVLNCVAGSWGEDWRGAAGRVAARSGHGGRAHMGCMRMMMGMVRSRGRCGGRGGCEVDACGPSTIVDAPCANRQATTARVLAAGRRGGFQRQGLCGTGRAARAGRRGEKLISPR